MNTKIILLLIVVISLICSTFGATATKGSEFRNRYIAGNKQRKDLIKACDSVDFSKLFRPKTQITSVGDIRIDVQGNDKGATLFNIQAQLNAKIKGGSTVAHVLISDTAEKLKDKTSQKELVTLFCASLLNSFDDGHTYTIS